MILYFHTCENVLFMHEDAGRLRQVFSFDIGLIGLWLKLLSIVNPATLFFKAENNPLPSMLYM